MRKILSLAIVCLCSLAIFAVPAKRGWQTRTQADGTTIEVQQLGDEFYHYMINRDGKQVRLNDAGLYEVVGDQPTGEQVLARRAKSARLAGQRRVAKNYGDLQIDRILVILVSFNDLAIQSFHGNSFYANLLNAESASVRDYFRQSSEGAYVPQFDVYGPVTLDKSYTYYGANDSEGSDQHPDQMAVDACAKAYALGCNFSNYDTNNDGTVDNIYIIYAGHGENYNGADENWIWPHSWQIYSSNVSGTLTYNGKTLGHYACSAELTGISGTEADGLGTFCHEFSHVIGLPDYYDTKYGTNNDNGVTPGQWTLMDQGSYNGDGNSPALYSIYDKYFMGWKTPTILKDPENVNMPVGGDYARQITSSNTLAAVTNTSVVYYLENRQQEGYDAYLPGHGMVVWRVQYNSSGWTNNNLNNTAGTLRYTIVPADGKTSEYGASDDPFPGTDNITSYTPISGHALTNIAENSKIITFKYNGGVSGHNVIVDGTGCTIAPSATTVENGNALTATITPTDATYDFTSLTVQLGSTTLTSGTHYTLSADNKTLTINASAITGDDSNNITITAVWTKNRYSYTMLGENCTEELEGTVNKNAALNLTITPNSGYILTNAACWDVSMGGVALTYGTDFTYTSSTNTFSIASVTGDVEILAYGGLVINWNSLNAVFDTNVSVDGKLTLPASEPEACEGKTFVGWCATANYSDATTAPTFVKTGDAAAATNYYAVFATVESGSGEPTTSKATSIAVGDKVVFVCEDATKEMTSIDSYGAGTAYTGTPAGTYAFDVVQGSTAGTYSFKNGDSYIAWSSGNSLSLSESQSANSSWSVTISNGNATIANAETSGRVILWNVSSPRFAAYEGKSIGSSFYAIQLYKVAGGVSYSDYTTSCIPPTYYDITLNAGANGALATSPATKAVAGKTVTVTATPATHYHLATISVKDASNNDVALSGEGNTRTFVMPAQAVTVSATFAQDDKYTVRFINDGTELSSEDYFADEVAVAPANPTPACEQYTFVGWAKAAEASETTTKPEIITSFTVTGAQDYYAIYSRVEDGGSTVLTDNYKKITATSELETGNYIVAGYYNSKYYAMKNALTSNGYYIDQQQVTPSSNIISTTDGGIIWKITVDGDELSFYNEAVSKYVYIYQSGTYTNAGLTTSASDNIHFTYAVSDDSWDFVNTAITGKNHLEYFGSKSDFTAFSAAGDPIYLYKQQEEETSTTYYSSTLNCSMTAIDNQSSETQTAVKVVRNGQILIIRDDAVYSITGNRIE